MYEYTDIVYMVWCSAFLLLHGIGPEVDLPSFYLTASGSISEVQPRIGVVLVACLTTYVRLPTCCLLGIDMLTTYIADIAHILLKVLGHQNRRPHQEEGDH